jgi:hypothetical protein
MKQPAKPKRRKTAAKPARKNKRGDDLLTRALKFYLENKTLKDAEAYAARGRRFEGLSPGELRERCGGAMTAWAANPHPDNPARSDYDDCESEYTLRGLPFPPEGDDIKAAMKLLIAKATEQGKRILADPQLTEEVGRGLLEDTAAALQEAAEVKKN